MSQVAPVIPMTISLRRVAAITVTSELVIYQILPRFPKPDRGAAGHHAASLRWSSVMLFLSKKRLSVKYETRMSHPHPASATALFDDTPRYECPVRTHCTRNNTSARPHLRTVSVYVCTPLQRCTKPRTVAREPIPVHRVVSYLRSRSDIPD